MAIQEASATRSAGGESNGTGLVPGIRSASPSDPRPPSDPHLHQIHIPIRSAPPSDPHPHQTRIPIRSASPSDPGAGGVEETVEGHGDAEGVEECEMVTEDEVASSGGGDGGEGSTARAQPVHSAPVGGGGGLPPHLQQMLANPQMMEQLMQNPEMLQQLLQVPEVQQMPQTPEVAEQQLGTNPEMMQAMLAGMMGGGMGGDVGTSATPAPAPTGGAIRAANQEASVTRSAGGESSGTGLVPDITPSDPGAGGVEETVEGHGDAEGVEEGEMVTEDEVASSGGGDGGEGSTTRSQPVHSAPVGVDTSATPAPAPTGGAIRAANQEASATQSAGGESSGTGLVPDIRSASPSDPYTHKIRIPIRSTSPSDPHPHRIHIPIRSREGKVQRHRRHAHRGPPRARTV